MEGDPHTEGPIEGVANISDSDISPVLEAALENRLDVLKKLIEEGKSLHDKYIDGKTALHLAAMEGHTECVRMLLIEGKSINDKDNSALTALHLAAMRGHTECVRLLSNEMSIHDKDDDGWTPLHFAATKGHTECVRLLSNEMSIHDKDDDGCTPLHFAAIRGHTECLRVLLNEKSCDVNVPSNHGLTPLMSALNAFLGMEMRNKECIKILLEHGASTKFNDRFGETALHKALYDEQLDLEVVKWLFQGTENPPTLRQLARTKIRIQMSNCDKFSTGNIRTLPLPGTLMEYVRLTDLEDGSEEQKLMKRVTEILL